MKFIYETLGNLTFNLDNKRIPLNSRERSEKKKIGLYPYFGANNILDYIDEYIFDEKILCIAEDGGSWGGQERCAYIVNEKCWVNNHAHVLKENGKAHLAYLYFYLNHANLNKYITGTTRGKLTRRELEKIIIPLPPTIDDQKRIAKILSECEVLIQKRKDSIALLDELLKSTFLEMFGDPVSNQKGWDIKTIEELVTADRYSIKRGPFGGALKKEIFVDEGFLVYEQYHALNNDFSMARYFIDDKKYEELKAFAVSPGDIIISCSGVYLGKLAVVPPNAREGIINQALLKVTLDQDKMLNTMFLSIFQNPNFKRKFFGITRGSGVPNFPPMNSFKKFAFIHPPMGLQLKYANLVEKISGLKETLKISLLELENLYGSLSQRAFKGELNLSKVDISDMEDSTPEKPEMEPIGEPRWEGKVELQDYQVHIDEIVRKDFENSSFSFKQLEDAIADRGVYVPYKGVKEFVFKSLEGNESLLVQELDEKDKQIVFKIRS